MKILRALIAAVVLCFNLTAVAETRPIALPGDTKLVVFSFDPNDTYTVLARPRAVTDIALHQEEQVVAMAVGDTAQWMVTKASNHVFIKPIHPDITTTATIVTDRRTYQLTLRASPEDGKFYQRVSWDYPDLVIFQQEQEARSRALVDAEKARLEATVVTPGVSIEKLNFDYTTNGAAEFKPLQVFDDGKFTWLRMSGHQEMPAFFLKNEKGEAELLNYTTKGQFVVIHRLLSKILIKLGDAEVTVVNNKIKEGGFWGGKGGSPLPFWGG